MARRRKRKKLKIIRSFRSVTFRILLAIVIPPVLFLFFGYNFVKSIERSRIRQVGETRIHELMLRTASLLEMELDLFESQALRFSLDPDVTKLLADHDQGVGSARLEALRREFELQTIAVMDRQGEIRAFSGVSPAYLAGLYPKDTRQALARNASTRFSVSQKRGLMVQSILPLERSHTVVGTLIVVRPFSLSPSFESAVLVSDQRIQSQSKRSGFIQPFIQQVKAGPAAQPLVLMDGSLMLGGIAVPNVPSAEARLIVGVNQRDIVVDFQRALDGGLRVVVLLLLLLPLGGLLLSRRLMSPVYHLIDASRRVMGQGEEGEWPPVSRDEFGILNRALHEMTDRMRHSLKQSEEARSEAERASRVKTDFLANISHELRTPLNGILGMTDMLMQTPLKDQQKECIRNIRMSSDQLVTVIGDIFDASRIESNNLHLKREAFDLAEMLTDFVSVARLKAQQKGLQIRYHLKPETPRYVVGDRTRIRQILSNLVNNAIKFTQQGQVEIHVHSRHLYKGTDEFIFTVKDSGIGMEQWKVQNLFRAFEQADTSSTRRFGGLGLGLTITSKITEKMSGKVAVLSELGKGSSFSVMLPLTIAEPPKTEVSSEEPGLWKREPKVLVAEDNKMNQIVVRRLLAKLDCQAVLAPNGLEAVNAFSENEFDIVLMDCQMPVMDGFEATRKIHEQCSTALVVALTAHSLEADRKMCADAGMIDYISKPVKEGAVLEVLRKHLCDLTV